MSYSALAPIMIGRQQQLAALQGYLAEARAEAGQLVLLAGEAGVGKTRLLRELAHVVAGEAGVSIYSGHCYDEQPAAPYGPFVELLRSLGEPAEPALNDIGASAPAGSGGASGDPYAERRMLFHTVYRALRPGDGQVRILILEDLHWADQASQDLLLYLARAIEADPVLLVGTYRTDEMHRLHPLAGLIARLTRDRRYHEVRLAPLSRSELAEMLTATLGAEPPAELIATLYERTEGNPFFVEELLGALIDNSALPGPTARTLGTTLPLSIRESVLRRVADLDEPTRAAISAAAVIGRRFDFELLLRLTQMEEVALLRCLSILVERQLIVEEPGGPEDRYSFRHELIRAVLYEEMLRRERRLRHQEVLRALEDLHRDDLAAVVDQLAYHALAARALPEAARYNELAGDRAARVHAYREALGHYEAALEAGEQNLDDARRADLLSCLGHAAYQVGEPRRAAGYWHEALKLFEAMGDRRRAGDLQRWLGRTAWELGNADEAFSRTRAAIMALEGEGTCRELAMAYSALSHIHMLSTFDEPEHAAEAIAWGEQALAMGEVLGDDQVVSHALNNIGVAMDTLGQTEAGLARLERSLAVALAADLPGDAVRAYINLGGRMHLSGISPHTLELGRQGWAYAARHGYIHGSATLLFSLCWIELLAGEWQTLEARLDEVLRPGFPGPQDERPMLQMIRALLLAEHDRPAEARALLESVLVTVSSAEEVGAITRALTQLYHALGDEERAVATAERALAQVRAQVAAEKPLSSMGLAIFKLSPVVETLLKAGRRAMALDVLAQMDAVTRAQPAPRHDLAILEKLRGWAALDASPDQAAACWDRAIGLNAELGYRHAELGLRCERAAALVRLNTDAAHAEAAAELHAARAIAAPIGATRALREIAALEAHLAPAPTVPFGDAPGIGQATAQHLPPRPAGPNQPRHIDGLTPRELEVLALITRGLSNRAIAETLVISEKTAEVHVRNILGKLGLSSRTQAATYALERGLAARTA